MASKRLKRFKDLRQYPDEQEYLCWCREEAKRLGLSVPFRCYRPIWRGGGIVTLLVPRELGEETMTVSIRKLQPVEHTLAEETALRTMLEDYVRSIRKLRSCDNKFRYVCIEDFVLQCGRFFIKAVDEDKYPLLTPRLCFDNAYRTIQRHQELGPWYAEGIGIVAGVPMPIHHAWIVEDPQGKTGYDVTSRNFVYYLGVVFQRDYVLAGGGRSLLDDWRGGYSLFQMNKEQLRSVLI